MSGSRERSLRDWVFMKLTSGRAVAQPAIGASERNPLPEEFADGEECPKPGFTIYQLYQLLADNGRCLVSRHIVQRFRR